MRSIPCLSIAVLCLLLLGACGDSSFPQNSSSGEVIASQPNEPTPPLETMTPTQEQTDTPSEDPSSIPVYQFIIDNALQTDSFDDSITYDDLVRSPDEYTGTYVQFAGKIVQVIEGDGFTAYRFAIDNDYDKIVYVEAYPEYSTDTLIENDYATLSGVAYGMYSYETVMGNTLSIPGILAARFEVTELALPEYPTGPLTLEKRLSSGRLYSTTEIESFSITDAELAYNGNLHITCQIIGTVSGSQYLSLSLKCYDADDILIETASIFASVSDGEKFRISDDTYIPVDTCRIDFSAK